MIFKTQTVVIVYILKQSVVSATGCFVRNYNALLHNWKATTEPVKLMRSIQHLGATLKIFK